MNQFELKVDDWIAGDDPDPRRAHTSAEFIVIINNVAATRLYDSWSRTVTDRARLPLYPLAEWLAINWWRLHNEAPIEAGGSLASSWRLSHDLLGIGGGLVWPRIRFFSDDSAILVSARAIRNAPWEPVRYLNDVPSTIITLREFDHAVEKLISDVLARLKTLQISAEPLATIWADLMVERKDPELAAWRVWEARLGYDPDQAPEQLMLQLAGLFGRAGRKAAYEIVPLLGQGMRATLESVDALASSPGINVTPTITKPAVQVSGPPWIAGRDLAYQVRKQLTPSEGPLSDTILLYLLGASHGGFEHLNPIHGPLSLGVRSISEKAMNLHFRKRNRVGMRFEAARFIADYLTADAEDKWLPLTDRGTARQKLQRAFAAELLIPIDEIRSLISEDCTVERFEEIGDEYGVSALAVRSHLANHGYLSAEDVGTSA